MENKKGSLIASLIEGNFIFPALRFYRPPQFRRDVEQVYSVNAELEKRMQLLHKVYKILAECDVQLQAH